MLVQLLGVFAEFERETIIDRVTKGMATKASKGKWPGGTRPYGYYVDRDTHKLVPHAGEAPHLREIFRLFVEERYGTRAIAGELNRRGVSNRTGKPWSGPATAMVTPTSVPRTAPSWPRSSRKKAAIERYHLAFENGTMNDATAGERLKVLRGEIAQFTVRADEPADAMGREPAPPPPGTLERFQAYLAETIANGTPANARPPLRRSCPRSVSPRKESSPCSESQSRARRFPAVTASPPSPQPIRFAQWCGQSVSGPNAALCEPRSCDRRRPTASSFEQVTGPEAPR